MPVDCETASHTRFFIRYHIVWIVKRRREILGNEKIAKRLVEILGQIGEEYEIRLVEIGTDKDHLHVFCQTMPERSPAWAVQRLKGISARMLRDEFPGLKSGYLTANLWGTDYYLATVGYQSNADAVRAYIRSQGTKMEIKDYQQLKMF